jgi:hypothetical protein
MMYVSANQKAASLNLHRYVAGLYYVVKDSDYDNLWWGSAR